MRERNLTPLHLRITNPQGRPKRCSSPPRVLTRHGKELGRRSCPKSVPKPFWQYRLTGKVCESFISMPSPQHFCVLTTDNALNLPRCVQLGDNEDEVLITSAGSNDILHDFVGFPKEYYQQTFKYATSEKFSQRVIEVLAEQGLKSRAVNRGEAHSSLSVFEFSFDLCRLGKQRTGSRSLGSTESDVPC